MINEGMREATGLPTPGPQLPRLAPPVDRTGTGGGALGAAPGVEADFSLGDLVSGLGKVAKTVVPGLGGILGGIF